MGATEASRKGRKRKVQVSLAAANDDTPEAPEQVQAVVIAQRLRAGVPLEKVKDQKAECFFGRMALWGWITPEQYEAGARYERTVGRRNQGIDGLAAPFPRGVDLDGSPRGLSGRPEPDPGDIDRVKADYEDMVRVISDLEHSATYRGVSRLLEGIIITKKRAFAEDDLMTRRQLKAGLNVLIRLWGIGQ